MTIHDRLLETRAAQKRAAKHAEREATTSRYPHLSFGGAKQSVTPRSTTPLGRIVATYDYVDHTGKLVYEVVRFEPKDFRQRCPGVGGGWVWHLHGIARVLYRLPQVLETVTRGGLVVVCEGEKDADRVATLGLCATTCNEGAGAWLDTYSETVRGARLVAVLPDNDAPGRQHAERVARSLRKYGVPVKVVPLPGDGKDVSDYLQAGGTARALLELIRRAPWWTPSERTLTDDLEEE